MGRNIKIKGILNWKSRIYINRREELKVNKSKEKRLKELINYINPLLWGISKIEYHYIYGKLKMIISGSYLNRIKNLMKIEPVEIILQELQYNYLDPTILARTIAGNKKSRGEIIGEIKGEIKGIRIEIKGITGKMTMSKKIIKNYGNLKFNSSGSIIDVGEARNYNKKGIISVKVWIAYKPIA
jgi:hypothetical protein